MEQEPKKKNLSSSKSINPFSSCKRASPNLHVATRLIASLQNITPKHDNNLLVFLYTPFFKQYGDNKYIQKSGTY